ncbi:MAG TPA: hypothetical protein VHE77_06695 [Dongiaceae bacterium]|jgi:hypothetical protein|nr:hypothetical protein [Dongiaceae bacterium]
MPVVYDIYDLMAGAILTRRQVMCTYRGAPREVCPVMLGRKNGAACVVTWQFAGTNENGESVQGSWKCLELDAVSDVRLHDGPWHADDGGRRPPAWLDDVDLDIDRVSAPPPRQG